MGKSSLPSVSDLRAMLTYDAATGLLFWRHLDVSHFSAGNVSAAAKHSRWNGRMAGKQAFTAISKSGKVRGQIGQKSFMAHRVIWAIFHGQDPGEMEIDHIDGNQSNNRIENLRLATRSENARNRGAVVHGSSAYKGVSSTKNGKWYASIQVGGKSMNLGCFDDEVTAAHSYNTAAKKHFGAFARLNELG